MTSVGVVTSVDGRAVVGVVTSVRSRLVWMIATGGGWVVICVDDRDRCGWS